MWGYAWLEANPEDSAKASTLDLCYNHQAKGVESMLILVIYN